MIPLAPKNPGDAKLKTGIKFGETDKAADMVKPTADANATGEAKPTNGTAPVIVRDRSDGPTGSTATPAAAVPTTPEHVAVIAPVTTEVSQVAPLAKETATVTSKPTAAPKAKAGDFAALQDGADKAAATRTQDETGAAAPHVSTDKPAPVGTDAQAALPITTGDTVQQSSLPTPTPDVVQAVAPPTAPSVPAPIAAQAAPVPIAGVAIEIATQAQAGKNHFEI